MTEALLVAGVDRCRGQWVSAVVSRTAEQHVELVRWTLAERFMDVVDDGCDVIAVDIPIGLTDKDSRAADLLARAELPGWARSRVFVTPPRAVLQQADVLDNDAIQQVSQDLTGNGVSRQALALASAIFDVEGALVEHPDLRRRTWEVHPELSFAAMSMRPALASKKSATGVAQRIGALVSVWSLNVVNALEQAPPGVPTDDCLDALAAAWSGIRQARGDSYSLPPEPHPVDGQGLRMAITV